MRSLLECIHWTSDCQGDVIGLILYYIVPVFQVASSYPIQKGSCFQVSCFCKEVQSLLVSSCSLPLGGYFWLRWVTLFQPELLMLPYWDLLAGEASWSSVYLHLFVLGLEGLSTFPLTLFGYPFFASATFNVCILHQTLCNAFFLDIPLY